MPSTATTRSTVAIRCLVAILTVQMPSSGGTAEETNADAHAWAHAHPYPTPHPAGGCSCDSFCRGLCPFNQNGRAGVEAASINLTLFRFTPHGVAGLAGKNSGDDVGDLGFFLSRRALTARCAVEPGNLRCFLAPTSAVWFGRWHVEVDAASAYGPYFSCNPLYTNANFSSWNVSEYACSQNCDHPTVPGVPDGCQPHQNNTKGGDGQPTCYCPRAREAVGRFGLPPAPPQPAPLPPPLPPPTVMEALAPTPHNPRTMSLAPLGCYYDYDLLPTTGTEHGCVNAPLLATATVSSKNDSAFYSQYITQYSIAPLTQTQGQTSRFEMCFAPNR